MSWMKYIIILVNIIVLPVFYLKILLVTFLIRISS